MLSKVMRLLPKSSRHRGTKVRYAVVGLGYISQVAVLPAFRHAENSRLVALVSGDPKKRKALGEKYHVEKLYDYSEYHQCLTSGEIDAVYIALPNNMHAEFSVHAANAGIHVLCEKPMALNEEQCKIMIEACEKNQVKLMIAYRLHFEEANLKCLEAIKTAKIGMPRFFDSTFSMQVRRGNIRTQEILGGGPLLDLGIYCINAARCLFQGEPSEVMALSGRRGERFREVDEMVSAVMKFPKDKLATFTCSFGAADTSRYQVVGTRGVLRLDPAYEFAGELTQTLTVDGKTKQTRFRKRDQFAPELIYFSDCILNHRQVEPSGWEGLADVRVMEAIQRSSRSGKRETIEPIYPKARPTPAQAIRRPPVNRPKLVNAQDPTIEVSA